MKIRYGLDPLIKINQIELLILRVQTVTVQPKNHKDDLYPQILWNA